MFQRPPLRRPLLCSVLLLMSVSTFALTEQEDDPEGRVPQAENIELDRPIDEEVVIPAPQPETKQPESKQPEPELPESEQPETQAPETAAGSDEAQSPAREKSGEDKAAAGDTAVPEEQPVAEEVAKPLRLLGSEVPPATSTRLAWSPSQHFEGVYSATPVLVVNGAKPGPSLCLTAAIHGDELNGIETVRRVMYNLDPANLSGAVIGVPIVNLQGFHRGSRYLTDRRDLNRHFPGDPNGSSASRIAHSFFHEVIVHCNAVVDLHTGSFYRTNLPQLRGDLTNPKVVKMTKGFGSTVVLHSDGAKGTLRRAAVNAGIPTVTLEAGAPMVLDEVSVSHSVKGIRTLLNQLAMVSKFRLWGDPEPVYYNSTWQRATTGGIIFSEVKLGESVRKGDLLGTVTNPITNVRKEIRSEYNGRVLGMAMNQVVQPGFAAYHIGIQAPQEQISPPEEVTAESPPAKEEKTEGATEDTAEGAATTDEPASEKPAGEPVERSQEPETVESDED
ncbi:succinylglutamate desuccinylase/aspartoacylase domain-containing protein [Microbulbifer rhizosphaerae]|uniref:Succinylglutamate desuccinylase/Aspartoacylase catalytic domain-containing protein n=1 Tax=Microbulbifer rhizosphaerae TaxID=1562603 RepID=A0A7W4W7X9_9GAMM|nr:succinylglutamate desuccinylase/aspartoacylase family protein [Microbulbifer rhizosphaerae]MBB3059340.1 hypothetical protein [Microbulbifer rhizosphaerae]